MRIYKYRIVNGVSLRELPLDNCPHHFVYPGLKVGGYEHFLNGPLIELEPDEIQLELGDEPALQLPFDWRRINEYIKEIKCASCGTELYWAPRRSLEFSIPPLGMSNFVVVIVVQWVEPRLCKEEMEEQGLEKR
jgi:hypothetical protein